VTIFKSIKFNFDKMDLDGFLGTLQAQPDLGPVPVISSPEELDEAAGFLHEVLLAAVERSTPRHHLSSMAKRWWNPRLRSRMRNKHRTY
jgi:hypothetical protein